MSDNKEKVSESGSGAPVEEAKNEAPPAYMTNEQRKAVQQNENALLKNQQLNGEEPEMVESSSGTKIRKDESGSGAPVEEAKNEAPPAYMTNEQRKAVQQNENALLKNQQLNGEEPEMVESSSGTKIRKDESGLIHLEVNTKTHEAKAKKYTDNKRVIKLGVGVYQQMELDGSFKVYDSIEMIHNPRSAGQIKAFQASVEKRKNAGKAPISKK